MRCPSCGASAAGAFCEYCGTRMPVERVETRSINAENVVVNNYYYPEPQRPMGSVELEIDGQRVVLDVESVRLASAKSRTTALLLCFFLGFFGAHMFYAGRYLEGVLYLFTLGLFGFGWLIDLAFILVGKMHDRDGLAISAW